MAVLVDSAPQHAQACSELRNAEVEILLQAITELHRDGILTAVEFEAKRDHLAAFL